jgi:hypothetical protein
VAGFHRSLTPRFGDEVFDAGIDYSEAAAYLLGRDHARFCAEDDEACVESGPQKSNGMRGVKCGSGPPGVGRA